MGIDFAERAAKQILAGEELSDFEQDAMAQSARFRRAVWAYVEGARGETLKRLKKERDETIKHDTWIYKGYTRRARIRSIGGREHLEIRDYSDETTWGGSHITVFEETRKKWTDEEYNKVLDDFGYNDDES
jgi:hypothetical protein